MKLFFKIIRALIGPLLILGNQLIPPRKHPKDALKLDAISNSAGSLALYQFASCPFCIKVRRQAKRLRLPLESRNILKNPQWHEELEQQGGKRKVPCLRIENNGQVEWLYESKAINQYLTERFCA